MRLFTLTLLVFCSSFSALAQDGADLQNGPALPVAEAASNSSGDTGQAPAPAQQPGAAHPTATTYSNGYEVRLKIHKYASWATLPLFGTELGLGQSLYNNPETGAKKTAHVVVGAGIVGLFGVNTLTGGWNLWEGRHDTDGRKLRVIHSILMLAADGGFLATEATGPHMKNGIITNPSDKSLHRDIAVASIGVGTVGYLIMLFKGR
ncbi:MAG TPA: hypothetical protein VGK48_23740 [Terriglobia bacterium]